ncbi:MAG: hypothetical protein ACYTEQ_19645 [Planctomycetota bacterium]|jgi:hypothetical protein
MAEEDKGPEEGNADDLQAQIEQATELLKGQGLHILDDASFGKVKAAATKPVASDLEAAKARLDALEAERTELAQFKADIENKGKSEEELAEQRQAAWEAKDAERKAEIERLRTERDTERQTRQQRELDRGIQRLLKDAKNPDLSLMWVKSQIKGLSVNDEGALVYTEATGIDHVGEAAAAFVSRYWDESCADLRSSKPAGPPTSGSKAPPKPTENKYDPRKYTDLNESLRAAQADNAAKGRN